MQTSTNEHCLRKEHRYDRETDRSGGVIALTMAAGAMVGAMLSCNGDGASGTDWGIPTTLVLSEITAPQRETFCGRVSDPAAVCEATGQGTGSGTTPVQACLDTFTSLPNCAVAQYQRCVEEQKKDPCGAAQPEACPEVATCPGMDVPPPNSDADWVAVCELEH